MQRVVVVAPHPDDETLGCGGTILKHISQGDSVSWVIVTSMHEADGFSRERIEQRELEIQQVARHFGFSEVLPLKLPTTRLDTLAKGEFVSVMKQAFARLRPNVVYAPFPGDVHSDHA